MSFRTAEVANSDLTTEVFHIDDATGAAQPLSVSESGTTAKVEVEGFSIYVITFAADGETVETIDGEAGTVVTYEFYNGEEVVQSQDIKAGDKLYEPSVPISTSSEKFEGWYIGSDRIDFNADGYATIAALHSDTDGDGIIRVDAKFDPFYYVTFLSQDGNVFSRIGVEEGGTIAASALPAFVPQKSVQTFVGWSATEGSNTAEVTFPLSNITSDATYYPVVTEAHVIHFDANRDQFPGMAPDTANGIPGVNVTYTPPVVVEPGNTATAPATTPTADCDTYTFVGWYTDKACTTAYQWGQELNEDITLYAKWNVKTTSYQIVVWKEKITVKLSEDDRDSLHPEHYDYYESFTIDNVTPLDTVSVPAGHDALTPDTGFDLPSYGTPTSAKALPDGSTVLNVYWNRETRTVNFNQLDKKNATTNNSTSTNYYSSNATTLIDSFTGLYDQPFSMYGYVWPTDRVVFKQLNNNQNLGYYTYSTVGYRGFFNEGTQADYYIDPIRSIGKYDVYYILQSSTGTWAVDQNMSGRIQATNAPPVREEPVGHGISGSGQGGGPGVREERGLREGRRQAPRG